VIEVSMAAYASNLNLFFSFGGQGSDSTYRGELTRTAPRRAALVYGEPVTAAQAVVVGGNDVLGAHAAGIACMGVAGLCFTADQLRGAGADYVITSLSGGLLEGVEVTA
jgi:phosphoglycolate phosphatase-like HAD superfamily hydrolase